MKKVLVFAGTTEGRELVELLVKKGISVHVCIATEYGRQVIKESDLLTIHEGRLDEEGMRQLYKEIGCDIVIDATHPYAKLVTETIAKSLSGSQIEYIRLLRDNDGINKDAEIFEYESVSECLEMLKKTRGNILLTTGSKDLKEFADKDIIDRLYVRVLPGLESLKLCYDARLSGKQIIAMQGPFSAQMNLSTIKEYDIAHLVTKESGHTGGVDSKITAAHEASISVHMIKRPLEKTDDRMIEGLSFAKTVELLEEKLSVQIRNSKLEVILAGIGPGDKSMMTLEVLDAVKSADYIFGAKRMLDAIESNAKKYPYYLKEDIIPALENIYEEKKMYAKAVVLFSGDSGFFSGCKKLYKALSDKDYLDVKVMPGISSIVALAAKTGIDWQDANIVSLHGVKEENWRQELLDSVKYKEKTFFIASGIKDIKRLADLLEAKEGLEIYLGYQLSYSEERVAKYKAAELKALSDEGLYCGFILSPLAERKSLVPTLTDDDLIRDKVPMTKEAIRKLSICQMNLKEGDVVYDIGSGTGSIAVQTALLSSAIKVYAIECKDEAVELIKKNQEKAMVDNLEVIKGYAPEGLNELPTADVAFIGGSKGNLESILNKLIEINPKMRVVMNAVSLESICQMNELLKKYSVTNLSIEEVSVSKANKLGDYHLLAANNPVFIFAFNFA